MPCRYTKAATVDNIMRILRSTTSDRQFDASVRNRRLSVEGQWSPGVEVVNLVAQDAG